VGGCLFGHRGQGPGVALRCGFAHSAPPAGVCFFPRLPDMRRRRKTWRFGGRGGHRYVPVRGSTPVRGACRNTKETRGSACLSPPAGGARRDRPRGGGFRFSFANLAGFSGRAAGGIARAVQRYRCESLQIRCMIAHPARACRAPRPRLLAAVPGHANSFCTPRPQLLQD